MSIKEKVFYPDDLMLNVCSLREVMFKHYVDFVKKAAKDHKVSDDYLIELCRCYTEQIWGMYKLLLELDIIDAKDYAVLCEIADDKFHSVDEIKEIGIERLNVKGEIYLW